MALVPSVNLNGTTTNKFGIAGNISSGMLMPKIKHRFKVTVIGFGGTSAPSATQAGRAVSAGAAAVGITAGDSTKFTQQVVACGRPQVQFQNTALHSYNSIAYYANKPEWSPIELTLRDDITNELTSLVSRQVQSQMNFYYQGAATAAADYKFITKIDMLDGSSNQKLLEQWVLEGCYLEQVQYDGMDYASSDPTIITLTIRYDNATQGGEDSAGGNGGLKNYTVTA
jgi:hypothetical protein